MLGVAYDGDAVNGSTGNPDDYEHWGFVWGTFVQFDYGYRINKDFGVYFGNNINLSFAGISPFVLFGVHGAGFQVNWNENLYSSMEFAIVWQALDGAPPFSLGPAITLIGYNW